MTLDMPESELSREIRERIERDQLKAVLLTAHRRENKGEGMAQWFEALGRFMEQHTDLALIYPIHPNLSASGPAEKFLASNPRVFIKPALSYAETCHLLEYCQFVVTDSGGIQEEAAALGIPTVVCKMKISFKGIRRVQPWHLGQGSRITSRWLTPKQG